MPLSLNRLELSLVSLQCKIICGEFWLKPVVFLNLPVIFAATDAAKPSHLQELSEIHARKAGARNFHGKDCVRINFSQNLVTDAHGLAIAILFATMPPSHLQCSLP